MSSVDWTYIARVAEAALALPAGDRAAYLQATCGFRADTRARVEVLLARHEEEEALLGVLSPSCDSDAPLARWTHPRFNLLARLGGGGSGDVYRALDRFRGKQVALKRLRHVDAGQLDRFKQEFRRTSSIAHPNVVQLHELFFEGEHWFFTMELVEGPTIAEYVRGPRPWNGPISAAGWVRLRDAFSQLASGLAALHASGIVHGDIKPQNVLVGPEGRVVVLDFGLVRELAQLPSFVAGTPAYMAPEQLTKAPVAPPADWYAFGAVLFETIAAAPPFVGAFLDIIVQKMHVDVTLARRPDVPDPVAMLCDALLRRDPEARPGVSDILSVLGTAKPMPSAPVAPGDVFVGRRLHLDALEAAYRRVVRGLPTCVHVHGSSGIGKTAILRAFLERLRDEEGTVVLAGRCYEAESVPFKALDEVVDELSRHLATWPQTDLAPLVPRDLPLLLRVFPALQRAFPSNRTPPAQAGDAGLRDRALAALVELVTRLSERHHVVVWIDDVQWGDLDSAHVLTDLQRPPHAPCLLLILSYRRAARRGSPVLAAIDEGTRAGRLNGGVQELPVDALEPDEGLSLATALCNTLDPQTLAAVVHESRGSPLLLQELAHLGERPDREVDPVSLISLIAQRVGALSDSERRLLQTVAVAGQPVEVSVALQAADVEQPRGEWTLVRARLARILHTGGGHLLDTAHDKVREAVLGRLSPDARRECHARLARAFEAEGHVDPERLVRHYAEAGIDDAAFAAAVRAGETAERGFAFERASVLYQLALELHAGVPVPDVDRSTLRRQLARTLAHAGRSAEAADVYLAEAADASAQERLELGALAAEQLLRGGRIDDGLALLMTNLRQFGMRIPRRRLPLIAAVAVTRLRLGTSRLRFTQRELRRTPPIELDRIDRIWTAAATLTTIDPILSSYLCGRHLRLALRAGEPYRVSLGLALEAVQRVLPGASHYPGARQLLDRARELAVRDGRPHAEAMVLSAEAGVAYYAGRPRDAWRFGIQGEALLVERCTGVSWELTAIRMWILSALSLMGQWREYQQRLETILAEAERNGDRYAQSAMHLSAGSYVVYLANDDPAGARQVMDEQLARWGRAAFDVPRAGHAVGMAETHIYERRFAEAWAIVNEMWPHLRRAMILRVEFLRMVAEGLRARAALGLHAVTGDTTLLVEVERLIAARRRSTSSLLQGTGLLLQGSLALARGEPERAIARLQLGEERLRGAGALQFAAASRRRRGELLGDAHGEALVREADAELTALGAASPPRTTERLVPGAFPSGRG